MMRGKKSTAERIMYDALARIERQTNRNPIDTFEQALRNATPVIEVKPRRVGGATYQVPVDIRAERRTALAIRWLLRSARARGGRSMAERLAAELPRLARAPRSSDVKIPIAWPRPTAPLSITAGSARRHVVTA
jgi:small subunit ribosomal protein S7